MDLPGGRAYGRINFRWNIFLPACHGYGLSRAMRGRGIDATVDFGKLIFFLRCRGVGRD